MPRVAAKAATAAKTTALSVAAEPEGGEQITLQRIGRRLAVIPIKGTAPLIVNRFSAKARQMMLDKQQGRTVQRESKDPEALYKASLYELPDGRYGFPATGFKAAIVDAARYFKGSKLTMTGLKQMIFVQGDGTDMLVPLVGEPTMREDTVRNATGVADIRFRGQFMPWSAELRVVYVPHMLSLESVLNLVDAAGFGGVGEWRPASKESKTGMYGTFEVADTGSVREIPL